jgi:hypothetical protein
MVERDESTTTITSWVAPGCEKNLRKAADVANAAGYNYLSDEHIVIAMLENPWSFLSRNWPEGVSYTRGQLLDVMRNHLPPVQGDGIGPAEGVQVVTEWRGPHADDIRAQVANDDIR